MRKSADLVDDSVAGFNDCLGKLNNAVVMRLLFA